MNAQFADTVADALRIAGMTLGQPVQARSDQRPGPVVPQAQSPAPEGFRLPQLQHLSFINDASRHIKAEGPLRTA